MFRQHSRQSPSRESQKRIIFLRILEQEGECNQNQGFSGTREGQVCSMKVANHTPATRFGVTQQKFSRHRSAAEPPMRNAVTLVVLEHVRTCNFHIPAVCVDVKNPKKPIHNHCAARKWARPPCKSLCQPAARRSARDAGRQTTKSRQTPPPPRTPQYAALVRKKGGSGPGGWEVGSPDPSPWSSLSSTRGL